MNNPSVLTGPTAPVSLPNPVTGVLTGNVGGIPNPDTAIETTLIPMIFSIILQEKYAPNTKSSWRDEYDYIIVGGGAAGSVIASRLSEKKCVSCLVLETGKIPPGISEIPAAAKVVKITDANWSFRTERQEHTAAGQSENRIPYHSGKGLGGSSLIGDMVYSTGNMQDYDEWEAMGAKGWSYEKVRPYFHKMENNTDKDLASNSDCHNDNGPMTCGRVPCPSNLKDSIIEGAKSLGYQVVDANCEHQLGIVDLQTAMRRGRRCSTAKAYLVPADNRDNLDILTQTYVTKIDISNNAAQGVYFDKNGRSHYVKAKREVILTAGAIKSPQILMLSGIGPQETLKKYNISVHKDLPVGQNLQDHPSAVLFCTAADEVRYELKLLNPVNIINFLNNGSGPLTLPSGIQVVIFNRGKNATTPEGVPNSELYFAEMDTNAARLTFGLNPLTYESLFLKYELSTIFGCFASVLNPKSKGYVSISSDDPYTDPVIDPNYFSDQRDVDEIVEAMKLGLDIIETDVVKNAGIKCFDSKILGCEAVADDRDKYLRCYIQQFSFSAGHYTSTVKMGSEDDPTSVVDADFRVKGIDKLRVIDASTMPKIVSGDTMVPTIMMAEKGADIIKENIGNC